MFTLRSALYHMKVVYIDELDSLDEGMNQDEESKKINKGINNTFSFESDNSNTHGKTCKLLRNEGDGAFDRIENGLGRGYFNDAEVEPLTPSPTHGNVKRISNINSPDSSISSHFSDPICSPANPNKTKR